MWTVVRNFMLLMPFVSGQLQKPLRMVSQWNQMEFAFPSDNERQAAIDNGNYVVGNSVLIDVDVDYKDVGTRVFVTIPRFQAGVPITLGVVKPEGSSGVPRVHAYPSYSWHSSPDADHCDGIISVFRVTIDNFRRLWVLDTGKVGEIQHCQPQLLVFNLDTDELIHRYRFPDTQYTDTSLFITPIVDIKDPQTGSRPRVYIADVTGFGLIVYDYAMDKSWRVDNKLFFPYPNYGTFNIAGESFELMDGLFGLALTPRLQNTLRSKRSIGLRHYGFLGNEVFNYNPEPTDRFLYFHSLASGTENRVPLRLIDNDTYWEANPGGSPSQFVEIGVRGSQSAAQAMDKNGNLFFGMVAANAIACWNIHKPYGVHNFRNIAQNFDTLQFISGLKVVKNKKNKEELWVVSCRFQKVMTGTMKGDETNFRIQALPIDDLLGGTTC